jgi:hypothetical protein
MASYIHPDNQSILWDALQESSMVARVFPAMDAQTEWFHDIIRTIYQRRMGGTPIALTVAQLEQCNRETIACMMQNLKERTAHDDHKYKLGVESHATRYTDNNTTRSGNIEALMAEQQRDLDRYVGEKRPPEIDFRVGVVDAPLDTADIESLLDDQKKQRMQIDTVPPPLAMTPHSVNTKSDIVAHEYPFPLAKEGSDLMQRIVSMEQHMLSIKQHIELSNHRIQFLEQMFGNNDADTSDETDHPLVREQLLDIREDPISDEDLDEDPDEDPAEV